MAETEGGVAEGDFDPLFTLDVVRDFMMSQGGKVSNTTLVTHFRTFLNDPRRKGANRLRFKTYVNTLATVKLDVSGEKLLVIKKKYRDEAAAESGAKTTAPLKQDARPAKQDTKALSKSDPTKKSTENLAASAAPSLGSRENLADSLPTDDKVEPFTPDILSDLGEAVGSEADEEKENFSKDVMDMVNSLQASQSVFVSPEKPTGAKYTCETHEPNAAEKPEGLGSKPAEAVIQEMPVETVLQSPEREIPAIRLDLDETPSLGEDATDHGPVKKPRGLEDPPSSPAASGGASQPTLTPNSSILPPLTPNSFTGPPATTPSLVSSASDDSISSRVSSTAAAATSLDDSALNVKEKARRLNQQTDVHADVVRPAALGVPKGKRDRASRTTDEGGEVDFSLNEQERDWMLKSVVSDYHPMAKLLQSNPKLASKKDCITGCTALHWAAKNGQADVIKMLCGTYNASPNVRSQGGYTPLHLAALHNRESVVDLLVKTYRADPNLRDYSGRKAKQLLGAAASTHAHQTLQPAPRLGGATAGTGVVKPAEHGGAEGGRLVRSGSYSNKIIKAGHFGISANAAFKDQWAGGAGSRSPSSSPANQRRPIDGGAADSDLMPPPKEMPAVVRRKPTAGGGGGGGGRAGGAETSHSDSEAQRSGSEGELHPGGVGSGSNPNFGTIV